MLATKVSALLSTQSYKLFLDYREILLFLQKIIFAENNFMEFVDRIEEIAELKRVLDYDRETIPLT